MILSVAPEMRALGLSTAVLSVNGIDNPKTSPELLAYRQVAARRLAAHWRSRPIASHPAIREYHRVHGIFGISDEAPAPEKLILYLRRNRDLTSTGALVDCYNLVSARTLLSLGAHDLEHLDLPITLRRLQERDVFQPLGRGETLRLPGEFGYVDANGYVICRMDVLQCEWSKVTKDTRSAAVFVQGNRFLSAATMLKGSWLLAELASKFCGGEVELVHFLDAEGREPVELAKPQMELKTFKSLNLVTATLVSVAPLDGFSLSSVTVRFGGSEVEALAPQGALNVAPGHKVLVAAGLHPLLVAGRRFTAYLPMLQDLNGAVLPDIGARIPEGERLR